ncbi:MAG: zf-TFIIB domain-containing protein [Pseudobdellovibrionaceae bacterium]
MKCPACQSQTQQQTVANVPLDVCAEGCGGLWFDQFEFKKFNEAHEPHPEDILKLNLPNPPLKRKFDVLTCPRCQDSGIKMMKRFSSPKRSVQVDECPKCAGIWLDLGELSRIRNEYQNDQEREAAAQKMIQELFGQQMKVEAEKSRSQMKELPAFMKYLSPSYYLNRN